MKYFLLALSVLAVSCQHPTNNGEALFSYQMEYFDGNGSYPFPVGVYIQYTNTSRSNSYNPDSILAAVKKSGTDIREAWDIQFQTGPNSYPPALLFLRLRDTTQYVDTAHFHHIDRPIVQAAADLKHYFFK
jgi:hypothetical protein